MSNLSVTLDAAAVVSDVAVHSKKQLFGFIADKALEIYGINAALGKEMLEARETFGSTGFGRGIAIPHARIDDLAEPVAVFVKLTKPLPFNAHDGLPVDLVCALFSPSQQGTQHLMALASISRFLRDDNIVTKLRGAMGGEALFALMSDPRKQRAA